MMKSLRVLSYNIHKGFSFGNLKFILKRIKESIQLVQADLVFLQEVLGHSDSHRHKILDWPTASQFEYLADQVWNHKVYGRSAAYTNKHHGNAILSRYPIVLRENIIITAHPLESRALLHAEVALPGLQLNCFCTHFSLFEIGRAQQVKMLSAAVTSSVDKNSPLLICGDFNDWQERATDRLKAKVHVEEAYQLKHGQHAKTFPCWWPLLRLDRIYFRGLNLIDIECLNGSPWSELSDHAALFAIFNYDFNHTTQDII